MSTSDAANTHPHWQAELARLEPRLGKNKAIVAIARKLLVAVWHVLTEGCADRFAEPEVVARKLMQHAYRLGEDNRPDGQSTAQYVREQLDRLGLGADMTAIRWGQRFHPSAAVTRGSDGRLRIARARPTRRLAVQCAYLQTERRA